MLDCISVDNMRLSDKQTIERYVTGAELMYRAANGIYKAVKWYGKVAVMVGSGNNGGDGYALACILHRNNIDCTVFVLSNKTTADSGYFAKQAEAAGVTIKPFISGKDNLRDYNFVVDCLLGTGFNGELRENYRLVIEEINNSGAYVVSADINSGMNGDTGQAELAVISDLTVTIGYVKHGLIADNAVKYIKRLVCTEIGIRLDHPECKICSAEEWQEICFANGLCASAFIVNKNGIDYCPCPSWLDMSIIKAY